MSDYPNPPAALLEPSTACAAGDRVPCHLFMPDVAWPAPLGPVIRPERARHRVFMQPPVTPWRPKPWSAPHGVVLPPAEPFVPCVQIDHAAAYIDVSYPVMAWRRLALAATVLFGVVVGLLVVASRSEAAPVVVVRAPVVAARPAPVAPRPAQRPVVHVPAPVAVSPSLARPAVRCERDGLGQCVGVAR